MLQQQLKLVPHIRACVEKNVARMREFVGTTYHDFVDKIQNHLKYLRPIHRASERLQKHGLLLHECLRTLEYIRRKVVSQQGKYVGCKMDTARIQVANGFGFATKPALLTGIAKVQRGTKFEALLTDEEKEALQPYLLNPDGALETPRDFDASDEDSDDDFDTEFKKFKAEEDAKVEGDS
jgi:hypothetical protein